MAEATSKPFKPRRWLKRLTLAGLALLALLLGLRVVWGHVLASRIDDRVAAIQAKGEPTSLDDLDYPSLPADQNGAVYLKQALALWPTIPGSATMRVTDSNWYLEGPDAGYADPITDDRAYLAACGPAIEAMRQAAACEDADWLGQPVTPQLLLNYGSHIRPIRELSWLMWDAVERAIRLGDASLAIEIARLSDDRARLITARPIYGDLFTSYGAHAATLGMIAHLLPQLTPAQLQDPAVRDALERTLKQMLDESWLREAKRQSLTVDRYTSMHFIDQRVDGTVTPAGSFWATDPFADLILRTPGLDWLLHPLFDHTRLFVIDSDTQSIELYDTYEDARSISRKSESREMETTYETSPWLYPLASEFLWFSEPDQYYYRQIARRRMAATAIAIKLYEADHGGRPDTLDALVPDYLPAVPADPYVDDRPIGYKPAGVVPMHISEFFHGGATAAQRANLPLRPYPLLYCVGIDFTDNDGALIMEDDAQLRDRAFTDGEEGTDLWFLLVAEPERIEVTFDDLDADLDLEGGESEVYEGGPSGQDAED
jgi:hypothetical protein